MSGKYSLELLEPRVMLSADGMAGGLITHDPAYDPAALGAIEVMQAESPAAALQPAISPKASLDDLFEGLEGEALETAPAQDTGTNSKSILGGKLGGDSQPKAGVSGSSAALNAPATVTTTPGASVAIPFHAQALVAAGPVTLTFTASGGASLSWDSAAVTGLAINSGAANTVSLQGAPDLLNSYLSSGKLRTGGNGSVGISGAVTASITVTQAANSSTATALPTLILPQTFTVPTANGQISLAANALGTGTDAALHTRTVVISLSGAGSTPLTAASNSAVGLSAQINASTITLTGTEAALSSYLATAGNLVFNGSAGSYNLTVTVQVLNGSTVMSSKALTASLIAASTGPIQVGVASVAGVSGLTTLNSSTSSPYVIERGFVYSLTSANADPVIGGTGVTKVAVTSADTNFSHQLAGLASGRYTAKAYAISNGAPVYSFAVNFDQGLKQEFFANQGGDWIPFSLTGGVEQVLLGDPIIMTLAQLDAYIIGGKVTTDTRYFQNLQDLGNNYSERITGWLSVPTSGWYRFWTNANNDALFKIEKTDSLGNKTSGWNTANFDFLAWNFPNEWSNDSIGSPAQYLAAGIPYQFELIHSENNTNEDPLFASTKFGGAPRSYGFFQVGYTTSSLSSTDTANLNIVHGNDLDYQSGPLKLLPMGWLSAESPAVPVTPTLATAPRIVLLPSSVAITAGTSSAILLTGASLNDGDGDDQLATPLTLTLSAANSSGVINATVGTSGVTITTGNGTSALTLSGTAAALQSFIQGSTDGSLRYTGAATSLTVELANVATGGKVSTTTQLAAPTQISASAPTLAVPQQFLAEKDGRIWFSNALGASPSTTDLRAITLSLSSGTLVAQALGSTGVTARANGVNYTTGSSPASASVTLSGTASALSTYLATASTSANNGLKIGSINGGQSVQLLVSTAALDTASTQTASTSSAITLLVTTFASSVSAIADSTSYGNSGGQSQSGTTDAAGGGGGGASQAGGNGVRSRVWVGWVPFRDIYEDRSTGGKGGDGRVWSISGSTYAGGGGGGAFTGQQMFAGSGGSGGGGAGSLDGNATSGTNGLGGGGGGAGRDDRGGDGGSGVVIISYPTGSMVATGGVITTNGNNTLHTFTSGAQTGTTGSFSVTSIASSGVLVRYLVVGGGGAGGSGSTTSGGYAGGGGGGGGEFIDGELLITDPQAVLSVTVGYGGLAPSVNGRGGNGGDSSIKIGNQTLVNAVGGGGGGVINFNSGVSGGSGGGAGRDLSAAGGASTSDISVAGVPSAMSLGQGTSSVILPINALGSSSTQRTLTLRLAPLNASDTTALGTLSATNLTTAVTASGSATDVVELTLTGTASALSTYLSAAAGNLKFTGNGSGTLRNLQLIVSNSTGSTVSTQILLGQLGPTVATATTSMDLPGTIITTPGATVAIPFRSEALVASGPVALTFGTSGNATLAWSASSDLKVSSAGNASAIEAGNGITVTIYGATSAINSYLFGGNLRAGGTGTISLSGAVSGSIVVAQQGNSSVSVQAPTLNLPAGLAVSSQSGQVLLPSGAMGGGSAVRTLVIQVSGGGLDAAENSAVGLSAAVTGSRQVSLSGSESALSDYLAAAGNLTFQGDAGTYSLSLSVQGQAGSVTFSETRTASLSVIALTSVTTGNSGTAMSPLITQLPTSLAITSGTSSSLIFTGLALDDGDGDSNTQSALTLTLSAPSANAVSITNTAGSTTSSVVNGRQTLVLSGTASQLQTLLTSGDIRYTGSATGLTLELANASGGSVLTSIALSVPAQVSVSGASAALSLPTTVTTTSGALVAIPFHAQALVAAGPVTITFTASGGASLNWDSTSVNGLSIGSDAANTVSLQGAPDVLNSYLSSGKLRTGGSGSVGISGAVTASITVVQVVTPVLSWANQSVTYGDIGPVTLPTATVNGAPVSGSFAFSSATTSVVSVSGATYTASGVGSSILTATFTPTDSSAYQAGQTVTMTFTVTRKALTLISPTVTSKVYDGTDNATITGVLSGVVSGDVVSLIGTGLFATKNVGADQAVTSNSSLSGSSEGNYTLTQPTGLIGTITPKPLTLSSPTVTSKVYDGRCQPSGHIQLELVRVFSGKLHAHSAHWPHRHHYAQGPDHYPFDDQQGTERLFGLDAEH
jgi:hypothetical protein